jgi:hypothetical protein
LARPSASGSEDAPGFGAIVGEGARARGGTEKLSGVAIGLMAFGPFVLYGFASGANHWRVATGGYLSPCGAGAASRTD